jgi:hypothetical protein
VRGVPTPKLSWARDGAELDIENDPRLILQREPEGVYKLHIHDPRKMDSGRFIIEATNSAGKEEIRTSVRFLGKEHYKHIHGVSYADPKKPHDPADDDGIVIAAEPELPPQPESDEPEMVSFEELFKKLLTKIFFFLGQMG